VWRFIQPGTSVLHVSDNLRPVLYSVGIIFFINEAIVGLFKKMPGDKLESLLVKSRHHKVEAVMDGVFRPVADDGIGRRTKSVG